MIFTTHSNSLSIEIKTDSESYFFVSANRTLPQPFSKKVDENYVNISINTALTAILPKGFVEREHLLLDDLVESYIHWKIGF